MVGIPACVWISSNVCEVVIISNKKMNKIQMLLIKSTPTGKRIKRVRCASCGAVASETSWYRYCCISFKRVGIEMYTTCG